MIEINLLPGSGKRSRRRGMPKLGLGALAKVNPGLPKFDRTLGLAVVGWVSGVLLLGWMVVGGRARKAELQSEIEAAVLDSARLAEIIKSTDQLNARMRAVVTKLTVVQEVDANRFVWPHLLDEIARAIPEYTWLVRITNMPTDSSVRYPKFSVEGRTGNNFALTKYLQQLEASPFIRQVRLRSSELVRENDKLVYSFALDADFEAPPPDLLQTEPLFASTLEAAPGNTGAAARKAEAGPGKPTAGPATPTAAAAKPPVKPSGNAQVGKNQPATRPRTQEPR